MGAGDLAGTGVYADRDFDAGEVVVRYQLQPLTIEEYEALPVGEEIFVHSYGGQRYLYPAPARFVNHSDDPSCYEDFEQGCDIALRPIAVGQPITIDAIRRLRTNSAPSSTPWSTSWISDRPRASPACWRRQSPSGRAVLA